jgi:hypothetical protein
MIPMWVYVVGIVVLVLGVAYGIHSQGSASLFMAGGSGLLSSEKPTLWWFVDDSQVNSREWLDWGNRDTREPNEPYLKICQRRAVALWSADFTVRPVIGRQAALALLKDVPTEVALTPPALWMPWCRAAFLTQYGGLWMDGSVLPVSADLARRVQGLDVMTFGSDPDEGLSASEDSAPAAGRSAGWASVPNHPMWAGIQRDLGLLVGQGPASWSAPEARRALRTLWDKHCSGVTRIDRAAEVGRDKYGRRLELDTLLGQTEWVDGTLEGGVWVSWPDGRDGLERAVPWQWFMRLSEEQIRESDFVWAKWATRS